MLEPSPAPRLVVHLLGEFRVEYNGQPLSGLAGDRPQSLLAYLLLHRHAPQSRRHLSFLLWPDSSEAQARSNLRNLFFMLRQALPDADAWLLSDTATIQWRPDAPLAFDVAEFRDHLAAARRHAAGREQDACAGALEAAIAAYGGDLLPGNYDDWLLSLREDLRAEFAEALRQLAALHESRGDYAAALRPAGRYLQTDPLNEGAYIQLMRLHALLGDRAAVQRLYQTCTTLLRRELDVDPSPATQAAFQELLRLEPVHVAVHVPAPPPAAPVGTALGAVGAAPSAEPADLTVMSAAIPAAPLPAPAVPLPGETLWRPRPLPTPATPFLGRERELAEIAERLADPHCRLLTLLGPGGIGKTRLALQVGLGHQPVFADGVAYVSLAGVQTAADSLPRTLLQMLAVALNAPFRDSEDAYAQLLAVLQPLELLLVIDNFEHAVGEAPFLADLLAAAPQCKLLVTSRQQLDLVEEWVYEVPGLPLPRGGGDPADDENSAVQLFVRSARRASHAFTLDAGNRAAVAQICRVVGGLPLAIELAASWVRLLPPTEIAAEIARGLDFLAGRERNLPERHRSLRAVFDYSWDLLLADERRALAALSVLQGGFDREAAAAVAGANLPLLLALAAKSLVQRVDAGRFGLHELVRQYAHEQLRASADWEPVRDRHLAHFAELTAAARDALYGPDQRQWLERLELEHDNLRAALEWAFAPSGFPGTAGSLAPNPAGRRGAQWRVETALRAVADIPRFWNGRGYLREGEGWLARGLALSDGCDPRVRADALGVQGWLINMLGDTPRAQELQRQSLALFRDCGDERGMAEALDALGDSAWFQGAYDEARQHYRECLALRRRLGNPSSIGLALYSLGRLEVDAGSLDDALPLLEEALLLLRRIDDRRGVALTLNGLGRAALRRGLPLQAEPLVREALAAFAELGNRVDVPECLEELAFIADAVDQPLAAARLLGAAAAMRSLTGAVTTVDESAVSDLTQRLSADPQHAAAYHDGSRFSLEQAVAYALSLAHANNAGA